MEVLLLGPVEVRDRGRSMSIPGNRPRTLLALLALDARRMIPAQRLIHLVWGEDPPATAANALQVHISALRKVLEPNGPPYHLLVSDRNSYGLMLGAEDLDVSRFERLVDRAHEALGQDDPDLCIRLVDDAMALWRGSALASMDGGPWGYREARRLEELRLAAAEDRNEAQLALGHHRDLIASLERLCVDYPLRERLRAQLMLALYRSGRQADASRVYLETRRLLVDELGIEPGFELQQLLKAILNQDPVLRPRSSARHVTRIHNLPAPLTSFVGREGETANVIELLHHGRLVTLTGPGGIGKTRLAIEVARRRLSAYPRGVWFVDLTGIGDAKLVSSAVATTLATRPQTGQAPLDAAAAHVSTEEVLIVLDGCESVVDACAAVAEELLNRCPGLTLLVTSRETLGIAGEIVWQVPPLKVPDAAERDRESMAAAVELFVDRAAAFGARKLQGDALDAVADICRRLDGIPLAIELAAARLKLLSLEELTSRLGDRFRLLAGESRTAPKHHHTLRAAMDWSYELLTESERGMLRDLSVFAGYFAINAVEAIVGTAAGDEPLQILSGLARKSMVVVERRGLEVRYRLLDTIREYAAERLREADPTEAVADRHACFYLDLAERAAPHLRGQNAAVWFGRLSAEHDNVRAALRRFARNRDVEKLCRILVAVSWFWYARCFFAEGREWFHLALSELAPAGVTDHFNLLLGAGQLAWAQGDNMAGRDFFERAVAVAQEVGDEALTGQALARLSLSDYADQQIDELDRHLVAAIHQLRRHGPPAMLAEALNNLGWARAIERDDVATGAPLLEESIAIARDCGDRYTLLEVLDSLAHLKMKERDFDAAQSLQDECLLVSDEIGDTWGLPRVLAGFVHLAAARGQHERAVLLAASSGRLRREVGMTLMPLEQARLDEAFTAAAAALGERATQAAWEAGAEMTRSQAIAYALSRGQTLVSA